jgi:hypothetical protein
MLLEIGICIVLVTPIIISFRKVKKYSKRNKFMVNDKYYNKYNDYRIPEILRI